MVYRKRCRLAFLLLYILISIAFSFVGVDKLQAQSAGLNQENVAIVMVIDASGSMRDTDPQRLRETAARIFIDLLGPEDHLGIITFDHNAEVVVPLQQVGSASNKESFKEMLSAKLEPRGNTDFKIALETAFNQLHAADIEGIRPVVIMLTDGEPDPDTGRREDAVFMASYMESLWDVVRD